MVWMHIAARLGVTRTEAQRRLSSTEFVEWDVYIEHEHGKRTLDHYYLAQITQEIRRVLHKKPSEVKLSDFLIEFEDTDTTQEQVEPPDEAEITKRTAASKAMWFAATGFKPKG